MNYHYLLFSCNVFEIQIQDIPGHIAQSVEHGTENPGVAGSIPALPTKSRKGGCVQRYARPSPTRSFWRVPGFSGGETSVTCIIKVRGGAPVRTTQPARPCRSPARPVRTDSSRRAIILAGTGRGRQSNLKCLK